MNALSMELFVCRELTVEDFQLEVNLRKNVCELLKFRERKFQTEKV